MRRRFDRVTRTAFAVAAMAVNVTLVHAQDVQAEYAVRWMPGEGGPGTARAVAKLLSWQTKDKGTFSVRYFDVKAPADAPIGTASILRERVSGANVEVTWKYRSGEALAVSLGSPWNCPLGMVAKRKDEMDVSVVSSGEVRRSFSRSCTSKAALQLSVPASLGAKQKGCASTVSRQATKQDDYKIEEWRLSSGQNFVELSWNAVDSPANLESFVQIVSRLVAKGVKPVDRSKTEIGTQCQGQ